MGCWNETCAVSRQSISCGEAVRFLPIVMNPYHVEEVVGMTLPEGASVPMVLKGSSGCYIGDLWAPLCYPIRGNYDDYGSIEGVKNKAEIEQFIEAFKKYCVPLNVGENEYHDVAITKFTLDEILEALQEGRCYMNYHSDLPQYKDRLVPISWMMIKESVWQSLLKIDIRKSGEIWSPKGEEDRCTLGGIRKVLTKLINDSPEHYVSDEEMTALCNKVINKTITKEEELILSKAAISALKALSSRDIATWHGSPLSAPRLVTGLLDTAVEMEYIYSMLSILRITLAPTTGSGSQRDNRKLWAIVNKEWVAINKTTLKEEAAERKREDREYKELVKKQKKAKKK